jgi:hypothetical protein
VPELEDSFRQHLTSRYSLFDDNLGAIQPILTYGLKQGLVTQEEVVSAINEPDQLTQISVISELVAEQCWKPFAANISSLMNSHQTKIRQLIFNSLNDNSDIQNNLLQTYDSVIDNRNKMINFSLSLPKREDSFGDENENVFAARLTFNDAYLTEFDISKFAFDSRLKNLFIGLIQIVMPYQFECSTLELNEHCNYWLLEEAFDEDSIEKIGQYISERNGDFDVDQLCADLDFDDEMITNIEDYGAYGAYDYWCICQLYDKANELSTIPKQDLRKTLQTLASNHTELSALLTVYDYFSANINKRNFPYDCGSDVDVSEQLIYSFGLPEEQGCIDDAGERFYNSGENAALNLRFEDDNINDFFENFALSQCMVSLLLSIIELQV